MNPKFIPKKHDRTPMDLVTENPLRFQCPICKRTKQRVDVDESEPNDELKALAKKLGWDVRT